VLAVVGATDLAVERLRAAVGNAADVQAKLQESLEPGRLAAVAQRVPAFAVAKALEVAGKAEAGYAEVAKRGNTLVRRVSSQQATQDLLTQGGTTLSRTKAAVTTARGSADETTTAARRTVTSARGTATTARKRAAATRTGARAATTSARKTAQKAATAAKATADKVGD
jgi:heparin binding hemagglutinin HbhA